MASIEERYISLLTDFGFKNSIDSARREGRAEGHAEGLAEGHAEEKMVIARKMKSRGFSATDISEMTGLAEEEIEAL